MPGGNRKGGVVMKVKTVLVVVCVLAAVLASSIQGAYAQEGSGMKFVADVTIPDDTVIAAGEVFTKTWKLENTGGVDWLGYSLQFVSGDEMNGEPDNVAPVKTNGIADLTAIFTAPQADGTYSSVWSLVDEKGNRVGNPFYVRIRVGSSVLDDPALATRIAEMIKPFVASMNETFVQSDVEFRVVDVYRNDEVWGGGCRPCTVEGKVWAIVRFNVTNNTGQPARIADYVRIGMFAPGDPSMAIIGDSNVTGSTARTALLAAAAMFGGEVGTIWSQMGAGYVDAAMIHVEPVPADAIGLEAVFVDSATGVLKTVRLHPCVSKSEMRYEGEFINAPARE
jgi:hypothetical protein